MNPDSTDWLYYLFDACQDLGDAPLAAEDLESESGLATCKIALAVAALEESGIITRKRARQAGVLR